ncbi:uncharacterized protein [Apostichopus japonicus]|uniref:uncharacterized protein isoform X2 n=1 Tax=Stichopus japonicus TaxID=307972 RepID=UPI003AB8B80C
MIVLMKYGRRCYRPKSPKLRDGGGFEYLKANAPNKVLDAIPYPARGSGEHQMKSICGKAPIYLRPIQRDLSLEKVDTPMADVNHLFPRTELGNHAKVTVPFHQHLCLCRQQQLRFYVILCYDYLNSQIFCCKPDARAIHIFISDFCEFC